MGPGRRGACAAGVRACALQREDQGGPRAVLIRQKEVSVRLESLKAALELKLHSASAQRAFEQARAKNIELQRYRTLRTLLAVLTSRDPDCQPEKDRLLRVLLLLARLGPVPLLWKSVLLYMFLPALWRIRHGYKAPELSAEDLDGSLWNMFFEVIESFPPHRKRIATGIVLDTRKLFGRHVQAQEEKRRAFDEFLDAFEQLPPEIRSSASVAETGPLMQLDDTDRYEMRAAMSRCPDLTEEDVDLIWETDVCGVKLAEYLRARLTGQGDQEDFEREEERLRRHKNRKKQRLYKNLKKSLGATCPVSASERLISG
jgi:hypothetical protein